MNCPDVCTKEKLPVWRLRGIAGWTLLTDDLTARKEATQRGIRKSGSIGCLVLAIERGLCTLEQANHWLRDMVRHNYRSPVTDLTPLVELIG